MPWRSDVEAVYGALKLAEQHIRRLAQDAPSEHYRDLMEAARLTSDAAYLLERPIDPRNLSIMQKD